jgi:DNA repair protein RadC
LSKGSVLIRDLPEDQRPRERLAAEGPEVLDDSSLIAILLRTGARRVSAIVLAQQLLEKFGSLRGIASASIHDLSQVSGLGLAKAAQLQAAFELGKRVSTKPAEPAPQITSPADAAQYVMEKLRYEKKEKFVILLLNARSRLIKISTISVGTLTANLVHPREVFAEAIANGAECIILVHNHPSGEPIPSKEDRDITQRLYQVGELMGVKVADHIIIGEGKFLSMAQERLMPSSGIFSQRKKK